jgi:phospholipid-transporting ATPase
MTDSERSGSVLSDQSDVPPARRKFEINKQFSKTDRSRKFVSNEIDTAKYNVITFLPKNLFEQFTKFSNVYFLILGLMELYKPISDADGVPIMLAPLTFVVIVSMIKDIFEDFKRHKSDSEENNKKTRCVPRGTSELKDTKFKQV